MLYLILQFSQLENLLAEAGGVDCLRVHVLEKTRRASSSALTQLEIAIGLTVQAIAPGGRVLSWYYPIDAWQTFVPEAPPDNAPGRVRYQAAWQRAERLRDQLVARLQAMEYTAATDGLIELTITPMPGHTDLIDLTFAPEPTGP